MERRSVTAQRSSGFQLVEVIVVMAVAGIVAALVVPGLRRLSSKLRTEMAAGELAGVLRTARSSAIRDSTNVGVKFRPTSEGGWTFTLYRDGDGDGVLSRDIDSGVDPQVAPPRNLIHMGRDVTFGFPPGPPPRDPGDPGRRLDNLGDPIRFNRSDLASFSPLGGSTPGSLYVTDSVYHLTVVRVFGRTGKVKVMTYDPQTEIWR